MKVAQRSRKPRVNLRSRTFTLRTAKAHLGPLTQKALRGEPVYIVSGHHQFVLQHVTEMDAIPVRPPGYFADCYTKEEIEAENRLSKASVIRAPTDLE